MSVNLRDRLYSDTGGVIQGATVQAILVTGGGTDAGTSSVVQSTTTTDVNGVWKFSSLPDPGAGNWYDVKITNGNQVRWRYGNIQAVIQSLLLQGTVWASPHFTSPVVDSGGLTITAGGLNVTGNTVTNGLFPGGTSNAASAFDIRMPNAHYIGWRNAANSGDIQIGFDASNQLVLTGALTSGSASPGGVAIPTAATFLQVNVGGTSYKIPMCLA